MSTPPPGWERQLHLDFHTPDGLPGAVGGGFDADAFADGLVRAQVGSLTAFALCHHGFSYHRTAIGRRHPQLGFDLFGAMAGAVRARGIGVLAYLSLNVNETFASAHPGCMSLDRAGAPVRSQVLQDGSELYWSWLCPNRGGWIDGFFLPLVGELLDAYEVDGLFIDMAGYLPGACHCPECLAGMRAAGLDPDHEGQHTAFNSATHQALARRLRRLLDARRPGLRLQIGCYCAFGEAGKAAGTVSEHYAESLPFQAGWGAFPVLGRYLAGSGVPVLGMTGRFLRNWGDFGTLASRHQLRHQVACHLMTGAATSIGDHLHWRGTVEPAVLEAIADANAFLAPRQPHCLGMQRLREIGILVPGRTEGAAHVAVRAGNPVADRLHGAAKALTEAHRQWDVVDPGMDWQGLSALIVLAPPADRAELERLRSFVAGGGGLLADPAAVVGIADSLRDGWLDLLGIAMAEPTAHPGTFYRLDEAQLAAGLPPGMAHYVHGRGAASLEAGAAATLAGMALPPFPRARDRFYGHFHGPDTLPAGPAILGHGRVLTLAQPLLASYLATGYWVHRRLLAALFARLAPDPLVATDAPALLEITLGRKAGRAVVQLLPFVADRRHRDSFESLTEAIPLGPARITVRWPVAVRRVWDPVAGLELAPTPVAGGFAFTAPATAEHRIILAE